MNGCRHGRARPGIRDTRGARGVILLLLIPTVVMLLLVGALAVEWGRIELSRSRLQEAADAAARYCAQDIAADAATHRTRAQLVANESGVPDVTVRTVTLGSWDSAGHPLGTGRTDCVRIVLAASVPGFWGTTPVGMSAEATAKAPPLQLAREFSVVGTSSIAFSDRVSGDSYDSRVASTPSAAGNGNRRFLAATGGAAGLANQSHIYGDVYHGQGQTVTVSSNSRLHGSSAAVADELNLPAVTIPPDTTNFGHVHVTSGVHYLPGGTYRIGNLYVGDNARVIFTGPASVYVDGNAEIGGIIDTSGNRAQNLRLWHTGTGDFTFRGSGTTTRRYTVDAYSARGRIVLRDRVRFQGRVQADQVLATREVTFWADEALLGTVAGPPHLAGVIVLVE